jgi:hypothetical protein
VTCRPRASELDCLRSETITSLEHEDSALNNAEFPAALEAGRGHVRREAVQSASRRKAHRRIRSQRCGGCTVCLAQGLEVRVHLRTQPRSGHHPEELGTARRSGCRVADEGVQ